MRSHYGQRWFALLTVLALSVSWLAAQEDDEPDALQAFRDGRYQETLTITADELETNPTNIESFVVRGWALNALGRHQDAVDLGLRALQINQFESRVLFNVGQAQFELGNQLQALDYLERYVQVAPTGTFIDDVYYLMGEVFLQLGEYHRADISLSTSVFHNSRSALRWSRLGFAREQLEEWEFALLAYDRALQLNPSYAEAVRGRQRVRAQVNG